METIIGAGKRGVNSGSARLQIGRLRGNGFSGEGVLRCGPKKAFSAVKWTFKRHEDGVDIYEIDWTFTKNGNTVKTEHIEARFDGQETVLFDDEHFILIEGRSLR